MKYKLVIQAKAYRALYLWLTWAAIGVAVHFAMFLDPHLWTYIKQDETKVTWITYGLFFLGLFMSFLLILRTLSESMLAARLGNVATQKSLMEIQITETSKAVQRFFQSVKEIVMRNEQPDIEALLDIELAIYTRVANAVDVLGNLLITMGLIGTIVGLTITLAGLTTSMEALGNNQDELLSGLRRAMSGMGTAFYATLLGAVLGGVLLRVFVLINNHGIEELSENLKKICMVYCATDLKPGLERDLRFLNVEISALGHNAKLLQDAMNESRQAIAAFREQAQALHKLGDEEDRKQTLRDSVVLQQYYTDLLKEEIRIMNKVNRSWWVRLKRALRS